MKAVGFKTSKPLTDTDCFIDFELEIPHPQGKDLLVKIDAISVNPVDYKVRQSSLKDQQQEQPKIIGWDAVGTVEAIGDQVTLFKKGDKVFYAGDLTRSGSNQEYQLVDERIVGFAPNIPVDAAAAVPLTALTAYEILADRMRLHPEKDKGKSILIIGGAGGVGSIAIQIAKKIFGLTTLATASRPDSVDWCKKMGADHVVNHANLVHNVKEIGFQNIDFILDFVDLNQYWEAIVELIKPQGQIGTISDPTQPVNIRQLKSKSASLHWELMFTRSMFQTDDMIEQHHILNKMANWLNDNTLQSTVNTILKGLSAENLKAAHQQLESGSTIGKLVITF
ncbi:zinc-binding alcohol dehydrogenase family protein [Pedobacter sp. MW01-1-1]|uniref:zinc-binding alcohol dehydrogenase family protein n=1 Tax=Pedobacter sp. MW01-1-1 TaxID=3383027 RepID=UPI003FEDEC07